jgi:hypothetical protein
MCARRRLSAADARGAASSVPVDGLKLNVCGRRPAPLLSCTPKASSAGRFWRCVGLECKKPLSTWTLAPPMSPQARYALGHITYNKSMVKAITRYKSITSTYSHVLETSKRLLQNNRGLHIRGLHGHYRQRLTPPLYAYVEDVQVTTCITLSVGN